MNINYTTDNTGPAADQISARAEQGRATEAVTGRGTSRPEPIRHLKPRDRSLEPHLRRAATQAPTPVANTAANTASATAPRPGSVSVRRLSTGERHLPGVYEARVVSTDLITDAIAKLRRAVNSNGIATVSGGAGTGKSFTVNHFLRTSPAALHRPKVWLDIPQKPSPKEVTMRLLQVLGVRFNPRDSQYTLTEELVTHLVGRDLILVVDEAHYLGQHGIQQLRYFHDRCLPTEADDPGGFALILVGSEVQRVMVGRAEMRTRVTTWIKTEPMDHQAMLIALRRYHPLFAALPPEKLLEIDREYACGNWRNWAQVLASLLAVVEQAEEAYNKTSKPMPSLTDLVDAALAGITEGDLWE